MRHQLNLAERSITLHTYLGCYRLTLTGPDTVKVEALIADDQWMDAQFPPWNVMIDALKYITRPFSIWS